MLPSCVVFGETCDCVLEGGGSGVDCDGADGRAAGEWLRTGAVGLSGVAVDDVTAVGDAGAGVLAAAVRGDLRGGVIVGLDPSASVAESGAGNVGGRDAVTTVLSTSERGS